MQECVVWCECTCKPFALFIQAQVKFFFPLFLCFLLTLKVALWGCSLGLLTYIQLLTAGCDQSHLAPC